MTVLPTLPAKSVQCVVTSPPYWGLRSYGFKKDDPARKAMIGLEPTFERHLWNLVRVFREVRRVLRDDGTLWLNYGDAYDSGTRTVRRPSESSGSRHGYWTNPTIELRNQTRLGAKNLIGMAWRVAFALQADGWILRSDIIWAKRSPMPESVTDRPTKAHEYVFLFSKSPRYFYDQEASRETALYHGDGAHQEACPRGAFNGKYDRTDELKGRQGFRSPQERRNMRSVWTLSTEPTKAAHFATFPTELVARCLRPGTSAKGCCSSCGAPWRRITESERRATRPGHGSKVGMKAPDNWQQGPGAHSQLSHTTNRESGETIVRPSKPWAAAEVGNRDPKRHVTDFKTVGWRAGCECEETIGPIGPMPCTVLDPFAGSGTVGVVCRRMGLNFVGVELNPDYVAMGRKRIERAMEEAQPETPQVVGQMGLLESEAS